MRKAKLDKAPEAFFGELGAEKKEGTAFIWDHRRKGEQLYAVPSKLAEQVASDYQLGNGIKTIEIIERANGDLLTVIYKGSDLAGFRFDVWASLSKGASHDPAI